MTDFFRLLTDPFDTIWWLGRGYHEEHGAIWPGQEEAAPGMKNPSPKDALPVLLAMTVFLTLLRSFFEKYIASALASACGIKQSKPSTSSHKTISGLEECLKKNGYRAPQHSVLQEICSAAGVTVREGEIWIRSRQLVMLSTRHTKFVESCWRFVFYTSMFAYGMCTLWGEDYFWDIKLCWEGYPARIWQIKNAVYWYYMIEMGYYTSSLVSQFYEVKRKDFYQMFIHHVATVILIGFSFVSSRIRLGAIVIVVHDFSDISLEACKMAKYLRKTEAANVLFALFGVSFFISRIFYYPYYVIYSIFVHTIGLDCTDAWSLLILKFFLIILLLLHCFWFSLVVKIVLQFSQGDQPEGDLRSEDEAPSSDECDDKKNE